MKHSYFEVIKLNFHKNIDRENNLHWQFIYRSNMFQEEISTSQTRIRIYDLYGSKGFDLNPSYQNKKILKQMQADITKNKRFEEAKIISKHMFDPEG
jgi:hypothetical protein